MSSTDIRMIPGKKVAHGGSADQVSCGPALALTSILFSGDPAGLLLSRP